MMEMIQDMALPIAALVAMACFANWLNSGSTKKRKMSERPEDYAGCYVKRDLLYP